MGSYSEEIGFLEVQATGAGEQKESFTELVTLVQKRLWHQITLKLCELAQTPWFKEKNRLISLHDGFVAKISKNLSKYDYIMFVVAASAQYSDAESAIKALEGHVEATKGEPQALLVLKMALARRKLSTANGQKSAVDVLDAVKSLLEEGKALMDSYPGIMLASAQSSLYQASYEFHKVLGNAVQYFKACMLYLTYTPLGSIPPSDQFKLAYDLALSALIGDHMYNFGEILQHALLKVLDTKDTQWLLGLLNACNAGDISGFAKIHKQYKSKVPELVTHEAFLSQKVRIMTLMEFVFKRGAPQRTVEFSEVAKVCEMKENDVEHLLMRAFSLGVIRGSLDQVAGSVHISWVQPRVLNQQQIMSLQTRLAEWASQVDSTTNFVIDNAPELIQTGALRA